MTRAQQQDMKATDVALHVLSDQWLAIYLTVIRNGGRQIKSFPWIFVTHHALSRAAQRCGLRIEEHITTTVTALWNALMASKVPVKELCDSSPQGHRISISPDIAVVQCKHERRNALVAVTMVPDDITETVSNE